MNKRWTKEEFEKAKELYNRGLRFNEIGNKLYRTEKSIKEKFSKVGIKNNKNNYSKIIKCECCNVVFESLICENRKYCSQSCAAKINNQKRTNYRYCINCKINKLTSKQEHYCSHKCHQQYKKKEIYIKIENNNSIKYLGNSSTQSKWVKKYLIEKHGEFCMKCGWNERHSVTGKVPIELEHKDGNSENNTLDNLELLCPNCHSLTLTYKALNVGNGRHSRRERYKKNKSF